jgi:hypothetical protein
MECICSIGIHLKVSYMKVFRTVSIVHTTGCNIKIKFSDIYMLIVKNLLLSLTISLSSLENRKIKKKKILFYNLSLYLQKLMAT